MEIKIGVHESHKELVVEVDDKSGADELVKQIEEAVAGGEAVLWMTDKKGRRVGVPAQRVAYVEITPESERTVGFGR